LSILDSFVVTTLPYVPKPIVRRFSQRYIAGETVDDAVRVVRELNQMGFMVTLDVLGEHVTDRKLALQAVEDYLHLLDTISEQQLDANISVKLTQFGLKVDKRFCLENAERVAVAALEHGNFMRIDMEDSTCTSDTLDIYLTLRRKLPNIGVVLQAYMRRSLDDIRRLSQELGEPLNIRVCKGIYVEPRRIAYKDKGVIVENFGWLIEELFKRKAYVGIATHDERTIWKGLRLIDRYGLGPEEYEFQMLLGVDSELAAVLRDAGHRVRIYVPFGSHWYQYSLRRLRENPEIAGYVFRNLFT